MCYLTVHFLKKKKVMGAPSTRNWNAFCNKMPPSPGNFYVVGEVETMAGNRVPILRPSVPQGINPAILMLTLTIEDSGQIGTQDIAYRGVRYDRSSCDGISQVTILWEGDIIASLDVQDVH